MNYILFDDKNRDQLLPLVFTRPVADIRIGILTIREKWEHLLKQKTSSLTQEYLQRKFPLLIEKDNILINGKVLPTKELLKEIVSLEVGEILEKSGLIIAAHLNEIEVLNIYNEDANYNTIESKLDIELVQNPWDIFAKNANAIEDDFSLITSGRNTEPVSETNFIIGDKSKIFIEKGATVEYVFLNTNEGSIYIGKDSTLMEGCKIRGPFSIGEHSTIKLDAKIYKGTTVGPHCKIGGEVQNVVFFGYTNKGHDGYLGNSVVGEWCNFGADTNNSNLKNTYDMVRLWSYKEEKFVKTGLQFCGLVMGDHSKTGINTMFNTGTVVGVSCNLFGAGYQRNFIPSFSWGGPHAMHRFNLKKAFEVNTAVMKRRGLDFDETEQEIINYLYENS